MNPTNPKIYTLKNLSRPWAPIDFTHPQPWRAHEEALEFAELYAKRGHHMQIWSSEDLVFDSLENVIEFSH